MPIFKFMGIDPGKQSGVNERVNEKGCRKIGGLYGTGFTGSEALPPSTPKLSTGDP